MDVKPGQVWRDNTPHHQGRDVVILEVADEYAVYSPMREGRPVANIQGCCAVKFFGDPGPLGFSLVNEGRSEP